MSLSVTGLELRSHNGNRNATREPLLVNRLAHLPSERKPICRPARPVLVGPRHYLRALRAAEMKAWNASPPLHAE